MGLSLKRFKNIWRIRKGVINRRNIVLFLLATLIITISILNFGSSRNEPYAQVEAQPEILNNPSQIDLPTQSDGSFNFSNDFSDFTNMSIPTDFLDPDRFSFDQWGYNISGDFSWPTDIGSLPPITFPSFPDITWEPPTFPSQTVTPPTVTFPTITQPTDVPPTIGNNSGSNPFNFSIPERDNKADNLPDINLFSNFSIDIQLPSLNSLNLDISLTVEGLIFVSLLLSILYLNKKFLPDLIRQLQNEKQEGLIETQAATFFIAKPKDEIDDKLRKERLKRLLVFRDHVEQIIIASRNRLKEKGADQTIISGYYDLDEAFASFAKLIRTKDITPLEHSKVTFETGEIDNDHLEAIVNLFYYARFGHKAMTPEDGWEFIEHLIHLVKKRRRDLNLEGDE